MDLYTIALLSLAVFLGTFIQTAIGFAAGLIAFPLLLFKFDLHQATAIMSIYFLAFTITQIPLVWKQVDKKILLKLGIWGAIGLILGVEVLKYSDLIILKRLLGLFIILYVFYELFSKNRPHFSWMKKLSPLFGLIGGFSSGLFSHGGSIFVVYINNYLKSPRIVRATIIGVLGIGNVFRIPALIQTGILDLHNAKTALYAAPAFLLAILLGNLFQNKSQDSLLKNLTLTFLSLAGIWLIAH